MKKPLWPGWMQAPTLAESDAEDAARREDEAMNDAEHRAVLVTWRGQPLGLMNAGDIFVDCSEPEWRVVEPSLKHVDAHIAPLQDWP